MCSVKRENATPSPGYADEIPTDSEPEASNDERASDTESECSCDECIAWTILSSEGLLSPSVEVEETEPPRSPSPVRPDTTLRQRSYRDFIVGVFRRVTGLVTEVLSLMK